MSARIVNLATAHAEITALLPWYVMGTLDEDEQRDVAQHLDGCAACRNELDWHAQLREASLAQPLPRDVDAAFAALRSRLPAALGAARPARRGVLGSLLDWWHSQPPLPRLAFALQPLAIVALAVALVATAARAPAPPAEFHALSNPAETGARLVVVFAAQATQADMRRVLLASGARVVDGPTAADAYVISVPPARADEAVRALRAEHAVLMVQSLEAAH